MGYFLRAPVLSTFHTAPSPLPLLPPGRYHTQVLGTWPVMNTSRFGGSWCPTRLAREQCLTHHKSWFFLRFPHWLRAHRPLRVPRTPRSTKLHVTYPLFPSSYIYVPGSSLTLVMIRYLCTPSHSQRTNESCIPGRA